MAFNFFQNPFDKLSAENQETLIAEAKLTNDALYGKEGMLSMLSVAVGHLEQISTKLDKLTEVTIQTNLKATEFDKKQADEAGQASILLGDGMLKMVEAIRYYEKIDSKVIDHFVEGIEKISEAFSKIAPALKEITTAMTVLTEMAKGVFWFGVALLISGPIYALALPLAPIVIGVIMGVMWLFSKVVKDMSANALEGAKALAMLSVAIIGVGIALYLASLVYSELWTGVVGMIPILLTIVALVGIMWLIDGISDSIKDGVKALNMIVLTIALVGIALYLSSFIYAELWKGLGGMVAILLTIAALVGIMWIIDQLSDTIYGGVKALALMVIVVVLVGVLLYIAGKFYDELFDGLVASWPILVVIGALIGLMFILDTMSGTIYDGVKALLAMVVSTFLVALLLYMISDWADEMQAGLAASWPLLILIGALIGLMYLLNGAKKEMMTGALVLGAMALAMMVLSLALQVYQMTAVAEGFDMSSMGLLLLTIAGLAVEMGIIGIPVVAAFVALGALTMLAVSASVIVLAYALKEWRAVGFQDKDAKDLQKAVVRLPMAFLGLTGDEGFLGALKQAAKTTAILAAARVNAFMMLAIGGSLLLLGKGLKAFKDTGFTPSDADNIRKIIGSVAGAFAKVTRDGGDDWSWWDVKVGIWAMEDLGGVLVGIAEGVQKWANLYVSKYEYDEKKGEMVEVDRVQLTQKDFDNAAYGMARVIGAIAMPLAEVGKAEQGGGGFWASIFGGGGYVSAGIQALAGVGDVLTGLASGVQAFADLKFITYEISGAGTKDAKMVPKDVLTITDKVLDTAVGNIGKVILSVAKPFGMIGQGFWGKLFALSSGKDVFPYSADDIKDGIGAMTGIGDVLSGLAKGIQDFANMTFTTYEVVGAGTKDAKIVPKDIVTLNDKLFAKSAANIAKVIMAVARPFGMVGGGSWHALHGDAKDAFPYSPQDVTDGVAAMTGIGAILSGLAKGVQDFANLTFTTYEVRGKGSNAKLVPKEVLTLTDDDMKRATDNMLKVILSIAEVFGKSSEYLTQNEESIGNSLEVLPRLSRNIVKLSEDFKKSAETLNKVKNAEKTVEKVQMFLNGFIDPFTQTTVNTLAKLGVFADHITLLGKSYTEIESIADSFERIADSMHDFKDGLNALDPELLTDTRSLFEAMAVISESPSANDLVSKFGDSIKESLDRLSEIIAEWNSGKGPEGAPAGTPAGTPADEKKTVEKTSDKNSESTDAILREISQKLTSGIKVKKDSGFLGW